MARATWRGKVLAESDSYEVVDGNVYFPRAALNERYFKTCNTTSFCDWKGKASYLTLAVDGPENRVAARYYASPKSDAAHIKDHVAFWRSASVER